MELRGKRALVTGAAKRMGRTIAARLAEKGCSLVLHYNRSRTEALALARELGQYEVEIELLRADLSVEAQVLALAKAALKKGPIDVLVNNASVFYPTPLETKAAKEWDKIFRANLKAPFLLAAAIGAKMKKRGGRIIQIADTAAFRPYRNYLPYCISKAGVLALTRSLALELAPKVQVNSVSPGPIEAAPWEKEKVVESIARRIPLGRWGGFEEIAKAVLFLCESDFTTGTNIVVDGGYHLV